MTEQPDLLLVNAPSRMGVYGALASFSAVEPPVWAGLIARYCMNRGFSVQILDAEAEGLSVDQAAWRIAERNPRLAAFCIYGHQPSASTQCLPAASKVADTLCSHLQGNKLTMIPTLALGTHPSALPERTLLEEPFDFVCQGEGPETITALLNELNAGVDHRGGKSKVPGLFWKGYTAYSTKLFVPIKNITDLDAELPNQAWELLDMKRYRAHNWHLWTGDPAGGYTSVQTSLGCQFACAFCCIQAPFGDASPRMRYWSPENVVEQITALVRDHNISNIKIPDEMFCFNRAHVKAICNGLIERGLGDRLNIWAYARVDTVKDEEMLELLRRAGFRWLGIGVESGSKHVRDGVEKGRFGNEQIAAAIGRVRNHGICVGANYIFGLPDDTRESCAETLSLACELNTEWANFYCAMAYPGSALHRQITGARAAGRPAPALPEDHGGPSWIGYSQHAPESLPLSTDALTAHEVLDMRDDAFLAYFTRPAYLEMLGAKIGPHAAEQVRAMTALGRPRRLHRELK